MTGLHPKTLKSPKSVVSINYPPGNRAGTSFWFFIRSVSTSGLWYISRV